MHVESHMCGRDSQILETVVGLGVIAWAVRDFLPLPEDLFKVNFRHAEAY